MRGTFVLVAVVGLIGCSDSHPPTDDGMSAQAGKASAQAGKASAQAGSGNSAVAGRGGSAGSASSLPRPDMHRPSADACDSNRASGEPIPPTPAPGQPPACVVDSDCTGGKNGRCLNNRGLIFCSYDECFADADCSEGGPCFCGEPGLGANRCLLGNCRTDQDCGPTGYCSPSLGRCGNYGGVMGYYCHTPDDACTDDSDCREGPGGGPGYCMYSPEVAHWVCGYAHCVG